MMIDENYLKNEVDRLRDEKAKLLDLLAKKEVEDRVNKISANFVQVSRSAMKEMRKLQDRSGLSLKILILLGEKMNRQNSIIISQKALCQLLEVSRQSIHKAVKILEQERWIKILKIGTANAYIVNEKVFWCSDTKNRRYATFSANIITTEAEQDKSKEDWESIEIKNFPFIKSKYEKYFSDNEDVESDIKY
ncbi:MarR family transcriptional regulator [Candidatus Arsenophonus triatominarum]|uniref:MarR family transcriptional regulator n=1 Tax=Candidatus Arsenophonus triatominarum TaxID=57911 RepID=UPI0013968C38|nr:helix-turn-helix domain-containing protein [Candidatus Arsenophonus triatominarum]